MSYEQLFLKALLLTVSIELLTVLILVFTLFKKENSQKFRVFIAGTLPTLATLPYVWFVLPAFIQTRTLYVSTAEISVVLIETLLIAPILDFTFKKAFVLSLIANMASFLIGLMLL